MCIKNLFELQSSDVKIVKFLYSKFLNSEKMTSHHVSALQAQNDIDISDTATASLMIYTSWSKKVSSLT